MIEILIAAGILAMFMGAAFSFYSMGSRMFASGSWKLSRQKEAERFMTILRERIEQASNARRITRAVGDGGIVEEDNHPLFTISGDTSASTASGTASNENLMTFTVCKPQMIEIRTDEAARGIMVEHSLRTAGGNRGLYNLELRCTIVSPTGYSTNASLFGLGAVPHTYRLSDVASCSIQVGGASGSERIIGFRVRLENPGHRETFIEQRFQARVDSSVEIDSRARGAF